MDIGVIWYSTIDFLFPMKAALRSPYVERFVISVWIFFRSSQLCVCSKTLLVLRKVWDIARACHRFYEQFDLSRVISVVCATRQKLGNEHRILTKDCADHIKKRAEKLRKALRFTKIIMHTKTLSLRKRVTQKHAWLTAAVYRFHTFSQFMYSSHGHQRTAHALLDNSTQQTCTWTGCGAS